MKVNKYTVLCQSETNIAGDFLWVESPQKTAKGEKKNEEAVLSLKSNKLRERGKVNTEISDKRKIGKTYIQIRRY